MSGLFKGLMIKKENVSFEPFPGWELLQLFWNKCCDIRNFAFYGVAASFYSFSTGGQTLGFTLGVSPVFCLISKADKQSN